MPFQWHPWGWKIFNILHWKHMVVSTVQPLVLGWWRRGNTDGWTCFRRHPTWIGGQGCRLTTNRKIPPFSSLPFPPVSRRQEIGRCNVCQTLAETSDTQIITTHASAVAGWSHCCRSKDHRQNLDHHHNHHQQHHWSILSFNSTQNNALQYTTSVCS